MLIATAGHVDHGKTTLVRTLTGVDTDRLPEEKRRGLTIDLGFAHMEVGDGARLSFIDVPGHERFIKNMVSGVAGIDLALLVVAADDGVMPQTVEHFDILRLLSVGRIVLVVSKADAVADGRPEEVVTEAQDLLQSAGYAAEACFIVSAEAGLGMEALQAHLTTVAEAFEGRTLRGYFRMPVDRTFVMDGVGIIATGTVFSGELKIGADLLLAPEGRSLRARALRTGDQEAAKALPGERCAINLVGDVSRGDIQRGHWLVAPQIGEASNRLDAELFLLSAEAKPLRHWAPVHCHHGAADVTGRLAVLQGREIKPGETALAQLVLDEPITAVYGDRFILRDQSAQRTIAGGRILDPFAPARGRARPERLALVEAMRVEEADAALQAQLAISEAGLNFDRFCMTRNITDQVRADLLTAADCVKAGSAYVFSADHWQSICKKITAAVAEFHEKYSGDVGINDRDLLRQVRPRPVLPVLQAALLHLRQSGAVVREGAVWRLPSHKAQPTEQEARLWAKIGPELEAGDLRPPREREIAENLNISLQVLQGFFGRAVRLGLVWRVSRNRVYPRDALMRLAQMAQDLAEESEEGLFTAKEYRDASGIGRNLTIELLEFFDRVGLTRRSGEGRRMVGEPEDLFASSEE